MSKWLSAEEIGLLQTMATPHAVMVRAMPPKDYAESQARDTLLAKGLIEFDDPLWRITAAGRAALAERRWPVNR